MKFLVLNDLHCADRPPLGRTESYEDDIIVKLSESWDIARTTKCDFVILTGDVFHKFRGVVNMNHLLVRLIETFRRAEMPIYAVAGNHDMSYSGTESISKMPFGVLHESEVIEWLHTACIIEEGNQNTLLIPRNWEPYIDTLPTVFKLKKRELELKEGADNVIMVAHASIIPPGDDRPYPHHKADKIPTDGIDVLLCGHIHEDLGIHQLPSGCWFANIGSVARVERTEHNLIRRPQVLTVSMDHGEIEFERHPLESARPANEVFFEQEAAIERELGDFAENLGTALELEETPLEELISRYTKDDSPEVVRRLRYYLTEAETNG